MLNREYFSNVRLITSELLHSLKPYYYEMTPFEQMLYAALEEHADLIELFENNELEDVSCTVDTLKLGTFCYDRDLNTVDDVAKASLCKEEFEGSDFSRLVETIDDVIIPALDDRHTEWEKVMKETENQDLDTMMWATEDDYYEAEEKANECEEAIRLVKRVKKSIEDLESYHYNGIC